MANDWKKKGIIYPDNWLKAVSYPQGTIGPV